MMLKLLAERDNPDLKYYIQRFEQFQKLEFTKIFDGLYFAKGKRSSKLEKIEAHFKAWLNAYSLFTQQ